MTYLVVLILALPPTGVAANPPAVTRVAVLDTPSAQVTMPAPIIKPAATPMAHSSSIPDFLLPSTFVLKAVPAPRMPYRLGLANCWHLSYVDQNPALAHDGEFQLGANSTANHAPYRSAFTGLWDLGSQLHADLRIGHLIFEQDETTLRLISVATTGTRTQSWQPGFVIGIGTTW